MTINIQLEIDDNEPVAQSVADVLAMLNRLAYWTIPQFLLGTRTFDSDRAGAVRSECKVVAKPEVTK